MVCEQGQVLGVRAQKREVTSGQIPAAIYSAAIRAPLMEGPPVLGCC